MKEGVQIDTVLRIDEAAMNDLNELLEQRDLDADTVRTYAREKFVAQKAALRLNYKESLIWDIINQEGNQQKDQYTRLSVMNGLVSEYLMISDGSQVPPSS